MKKAQRKVKRFGKSMKQVGSSMTTNLTMPIVGLGAVAIKTFANFEQAMLKVKAVSGATGAEFKSLQDNAKRLGSSTMFTASQVAELQLELSKLGLTPEEINKSTDSILSLAQATGHDLADSATIVASTMNSFGMEASDATKVADMFAVASSSAAIDMEKLSVAMPTVGATANAVGVPLEDLTSMMMTLADSGMEASTMGTHLRKIFVELATKGISFEDAMSKINTSTDKVTTATDLFGKRAFGAGLILAGNIQKTEDYSKALDESAGKSQEMADIMDSGAAGAMRRLASQAEGVAIQLGGMLIPVFEKLMGFIQKSLTWWSGLDSGMKKTIVSIGLIIAALGPLVSLVGTLTIAFSTMLSPVGLIISAFAILGASIIWIYKNIDALTTLIANKFASEFGAGFWTAMGAAMKTMGISGGDALVELGAKMAVVVATGEDLPQEEFLSFTDIIKDAATAMSDMASIDLGGGISSGSKSTGKEETGGSGLISLEVDTGGPIAAIKSVSDAILNASTDTTKTLSEIWEDFWDDWGGNIVKTIGVAQKAMQSIGQLASSVAKKESITLENEKSKQQGILDADYQKQLERIENGIMDEESKQIAIEELNLKFSQKQANLDEQMAQKEKAMKIKQAKRDKAMAIMNAIVNGASAVVESLPNIPLSILVGGMAIANVATIASTPIPAFADGGIVSGPTVGLMGEYPGAGSGNPEVIAPLKKLQGMMGGNENNKTIQIVGRLSGNDIYLSNSKQATNRLRFV